MIGTSEVVSRLRAEGFKVSHAYTAYLLREGIVLPPAKGPGGALHWGEDDVAALRAELVRRGRFGTPGECR